MTWRYPSGGIELAHLCRLVFDSMEALSTNAVIWAHRLSLTQSATSLLPVSTCDYQIRHMGHILVLNIKDLEITLRRKFNGTSFNLGLELWRQLSLQCLIVWDYRVSLT